VPSGACLLPGSRVGLKFPILRFLRSRALGLAFLPFAPAIEIEPDIALALMSRRFCSMRLARPERYAVSVASLAVVAVNFAVAGFPFPEPLPSTE
jgi:hypothetical protein